MTRLEITKRAGLANGERARALTHCRRGHEYTPQTVRMTSAGCRQCLPCTKIVKAEYKKANAEHTKRWHRSYTLARKYGISVARFEEMLSEQGGLCAICGTNRPGGNNWHVDHCHVTGAVRGILCVRCNAGLGYFRESVSVLESAIAYLKKHA